MIVRYSRLDRDLKKGLYLDFKLEVQSNENGYLIEIIDEDNNVVYKSEDVVKTGDILYDTAYMQKEYFRGISTTFTVRKRSKSNNLTYSVSGGSITCNTFKVNIDNVEVKPQYDDNDNVVLYKTYIRWNYDSFTTKDLYVKALLYPVKDDNKDISYENLNSMASSANSVSLTQALPPRCPASRCSCWKASGASSQL